MRHIVISAAYYLIVYLGYLGVVYLGFRFLQPRSAKCVWRALAVGLFVTAADLLSRLFFLGNGLAKLVTGGPAFPEEMRWFGLLLQFAAQWIEWLLFSTLIVLFARPIEKPKRGVILTCIIWSLGGVGISYVMLMLSMFIVFGLGG